MRKICEDPDENAEKLYGDNLDEKLTKVQAENKLYKTLEDKDPKKNYQKSGNSKTHQKSRGGSNTNQKDGYTSKRKEDQGKDRDQKESKDRSRPSTSQNKSNRRGGKHKRR